MKYNLDLKLNKNAYFLDKRVFKYKELSIKEIRLLIVLSTKKGLTINELDTNTKKWIINDNTYTVKQFSEMANKLIQRGLLDSNGLGLDFKKLKITYVIFRNVEIIESCKTIRQLFLHSLRMWHKNSKDIILSVEVFKGLFGDTIKLINFNWKATLKQTGFKFEYSIKNNKVYILDNNLASNGMNQDITVAKKKVQKRDITKNLLSSINTTRESDIPEPLGVDISRFDFLEI